VGTSRHASRRGLARAATPSAAVTPPVFASLDSTPIEPRMHPRRVRSPYARVLTPVDLSAIVRASPSPHRHATRTTHARHSAHLAAPAVAFNSQAQPLAR